MEIICHKPDTWKVPAELDTILKKLRYKPSVKLYIRPGEWNRRDSVHVHPTMLAVDVNSEKEINLFGEPVVWFPEIAEKQFVLAVFRKIKALEYHECAEQFQYNGVRVFDPHIDSSEQEKRLITAVGDDLISPEILKARENRD